MKKTYAGLFFTSLAALMLEILLTRVFSVATWYYFAFFAISVAMFGLTVGAIFVYKRADLFTEEKLGQRMALFAMLFAVSVDLALFIFLSIPFYPRLTGLGVFATAFIYLVIAFPFACAGVVVCLCLTRYPEKTGLFYAADLAGAGVGAFMVFPVLNAMDAPTAVLLVGAVGALAAVFFAAENAKTASLKKASSAVFVALTVLMAINFVYQPLRVEWVKASFNVPEFELWNSFSRIAVYPTRMVSKPYSWGLSSAYKPDHPIVEKMIDIDGVSETVMTYYDGNPKSVEHLKYDVTHIAHYLRDNAKVFVIGVGGGRDILAAKVFGQREVVGAEINNRTLEMLNFYFADMTGHLDKLPGVRIITDEARSAITRGGEKFDIIQASCIATWSATTAGAFSLAENSLFTVEGWKIFYDHLTPDGVLSFNRWFSPDYPAQLMRLATLASVTLKNEGVKEPGRHIAIVRNEIVNSMMPSGTILVSKRPFSAEDIKRLTAAVDALKFKFVYNPAGFKDPAFQEVIDNADKAEFHEKTLVDLSPSTDDRPFFFYMLRLKDIFSGKKVDFNEQRFNLKGITMLFILMFVSVGLSIAFIFGPLLIKTGREADGRAKMPFSGGALGLVFFGSIGFGYILVEIALLQRLIIFLGHPIYSITVVIFAMLLSSGLGSVVSGAFTKNGLKRGTIAAVMSAVILLLLFVIYAQPGILNSFETSGVTARIAVSLLFLLPLGFFMGMPFPMGMSLASQSLKAHTPWFWAVNGATSVVSSVASVCISITWGFTATLLVGLGFYALAAVSLLLFYGAAVALKRTA